MKWQTILTMTRRRRSSKIRRQNFSSFKSLHFYVVFYRQASRDYHSL